MKHFEEQVSQAAIRLRNEENGRLCVPRNPRRGSGISWGWVATPVAAVVGLLWGVELGKMSDESSFRQVAQEIDTVICHEAVRDTVYFVRPESKVASWQDGRESKAGGISRSDFSVTNPEPEKKTVTLPTRTGKCVLEDGIDYSMLWEPVAIR